ncbi:MAG: citrate synthase/methylcitrate synthase [Proteobacteria bacterium]|nr:citrate synthase/methylcitrate synthase [Pseudomonadota bacterium]
MTTGLDDVIAAETALSQVDGENGTLIIRGISIEEVAETHRFEDMAALLWSAFLDQPVGAASIARDLGAARVRAAERLPALLKLTADREPIDALRVALAAVPCSDHHQECLDVTATVAVTLAALHRRETGQASIPPSPELPHGEDLCRMLHGQSEPDHIQALETYLVTVADHGMNASTFTARVIASTQSDIVSAVTGALGALKGPLHGGAPGPVLDMLDEIGDKAGIAAWIDRHLDDGERLMGSGHRIYRSRDPRADVLKSALARFGARDDNRIAFAEQVERTARDTLARRYPDRRLDTNVEFYTALLLEAVGMDRRFFTPLFAAGRVLGWTAHVMEQQQGGRLIRPLSRYVGPTPTGQTLRAVAAG